MASNTSQFVQDIISFYSQNNFYAILDQIYEVATNPSTSESDKLALKSLLWPIPRFMDLKMLGGFITSRDIGHIYSVGCGTGLLEYLLMEVMGLKDDYYEDDEEEDYNSTSTNNNNLIVRPGLTGIEIDSNWWKSPYAPPSFIQLCFINETFTYGVPFGSQNDCILFSYFNYMSIFVEYLNHFNGAFVIIIGPNRSTSNKKQYCAPSPLDLRDGDSDYDDGDEQNSVVDDAGTTETTDKDKEKGAGAGGVVESRARRVVVDKSHTNISKCKIPKEKWNLVLYQRFGLEEVDNVAIYSRA